MLVDLLQLGLGGEHPVVVGGGEVSHALNRAVVSPNGIVQLDTVPTENRTN